MIDFLEKYTVIAFFFFPILAAGISVGMFEIWLILIKTFGLKQRFIAVRLVNFIIVICSLMVFIQLVVITGKELFPQKLFSLATIFWGMTILTYLFKSFLKRVPE